MHPALTVVLINNSGGGIFSMLPGTELIPDAAFTQLWATPPNADLSSAPLPRAAGPAFVCQRVATVSHSWLLQAQLAAHASRTFLTQTAEDWLKLPWHAGLCRAHGIPHQKVATTAELLPALQVGHGCMPAISESLGSFACFSAALCAAWGTDCTPVLHESR